MILDPFPALRTFDRLATAIFTKSDDIGSDAAAAAALGFAKTAGFTQVHGNGVTIVREPVARTIEGDAMLTDVPGLLLCTRWADCQNFVLFAPGQRVVGVIHAGWKGLVAGVIPATIAAMRSEWNSHPQDIVVAAGPSLCKRCSDFSDPERELPGLPAHLRDGKHADLRGWAEAQLSDSGVLPAHFERMDGCTRCEPGTYWTYRGGHREEVKAKHTNMSVAGLKAA